MSGQQINSVDKAISIGYLVTPSSSSEYLVLCDERQKDLSFSENSLVYVRYKARVSSGKVIEVETLGYTGELRLENPYSQTPIDRVALAHHGDEIDGDGVDQKYLKVYPLATINLENGQPLPIGLPPSRSRFYFVEEAQLENYYRSRETTYKFGYLSGTNVPIGLDVRHFGQGDKGWGDARMIGVAGRTGSGKTVVVAGLVGAYAIHQELGILIVDPQGQFGSLDRWGQYVGELGKNPQKWSWKMSAAFAQAQRLGDVTVVKSSEINLGNDIQTFLALLRKQKFWESLRGGIKSDKIDLAETQLLRFLDEKKQAKKPLTDLKWSENLFDLIVDIVTAGYRDQDEQKNLIYTRTGASDRAGEIWDAVLSYFDPEKRPYSMDNLVRKVLVGRKIVILDIDEPEDDMKQLFQWKLFSALKLQAQRIYYDALSKGQQSNVNALIVVDEAQRIIPEFPEGELQKNTLSVVKDAINTGRKLGIGWIFATQSVTNIDKGIWGQMGTKIVGYGFGTGADRERLMEICGNDREVLNRYLRMPMPLQTGTYWFLVQGELVGLGNGNQSLFVDCFPTQADTLNHNRHLTQK